MAHFTSPYPYMSPPYLSESYGKIREWDFPMSFLVSRRFHLHLKGRNQEKGKYEV